MMFAQVLKIEPYIRKNSSQEVDVSSEVVQYS